MKEAHSYSAVLIGDILLCAWADFGFCLLFVVEVSGWFFVSDFVMYKYLALSGGGIKGLSLLGSLRLLEGLGLLSDVEEYVGSSIGGVLVTMLASGFTARDMFEISFAINPSDFVDYNFVEMFSRLGLESGEKIVKLFRSMLMMKMSPDVTFKEHSEITGKMLTLTGTCLNDKRLYYFNAVRSPNMKVIDALRITISFPIFFTPVEYDGKLFVDGAFLAPNPAIYFKGRGGGDESGSEFDWNKLLVLFSNTEQKFVESKAMLDDPALFLTNILNTFKVSYIEENIGEFVERGRVIIFDNNSFAMDFGLTDKDKFQLYLKGARITFQFMFGEGNGEGKEWGRVKLFGAFKRWKSFQGKMGGEKEREGEKGNQ